MLILSEGSPNQYLIDLFADAGVFNIAMLGPGALTTIATLLLPRYAISESN